MINPVIGFGVGPESGLERLRDNKGYTAQVMADSDVDIAWIPAGSPVVEPGVIGDIDVVTFKYGEPQVIRHGEVAVGAMQDLTMAGRFSTVDHGVPTLNSRTVLEATDPTNFLTNFSDFVKPFYRVYTRGELNDAVDKLNGLPFTVMGADGLPYDGESMFDYLRAEDDTGEPRGLTVQAGFNNILPYGLVGVKGKDNVLLGNKMANKELRFIEVNGQHFPIVKVTPDVTKPKLFSYAAIQPDSVGQDVYDFVESVTGHLKALSGTDEVFTAVDLIFDPVSNRPYLTGIKVHDPMLPTRKDNFEQARDTRINLTNQLIRMATAGV